ncbi:hypothetical protein P0082_02545 [Candidatus Haliotispira prima]|uniref:GWxTD domain-containing protein n=1 Tax=Candidatus Haliotispira prima TaxID=3034016 RepID=A0ABY8MIW4_9SPIO|nr:hypothetical protein P0082_02545 [Candidatus Haliotispira prima]
MVAMNDFRAYLLLFSQTETDHETEPKTDRESPQKSLLFRTSLPGTWPLRLSPSLSFWLRAVCLGGTLALAAIQSDALQLPLSAQARETGKPEQTSKPTEQAERSKAELATTRSANSAQNGTESQNVKKIDRTMSAQYLFQRKTKLRFLDYEFARKYLKEAYILSEEDRAVEVQKLLRLSKEYRGDDTSDYWYLLATAYEDKWEKSRFDWLNKAFELDQWFEVPPLPPALALVRILYKWGMYDDIIAWAQKWKPEISNDKEVQFYLAMAYNNSGQKKKAKELALNNLERYNYEERYFRILLDIPNVSKEMWVNFHFYLENYPPDSPNLLRYLVSKSTDINQTENLLSVYTGLFGDDYFTTAQRILLRQDDLVPRSDIFFKNYKTSDFLILSRVIRGVSGIRPIEESLKDLNGLYIIDRDYDGIPEEELTFINGDLTERHLFPGSPYENDIKIRWSSYGEPAGYHSFYNYNGSSSTIDISYGRYPFIREITVSDHDSRRTYSFSPGRLMYSISHEVPLNTFEWALSPLRKPTLLESDIMRNSREVKLYETRLRQSDWQLRAKYNMDYLGQLKEIHIDRNLDGTFDEISHFENSRRVKTLRDENQDGRFELSVSYEDGRLRKYEVDLNGNGNVDYTETLGDVPGKTWHTYGGLDLPGTSYKFQPEKTDYIYSYYFKWSNETVSVFAPEYLESRK